MASSSPDDVYVKSSPIHGQGVFARRTFATGQRILTRSERPVTAEHPLDASKGEFEHHCDWLEGGRQVYLGYPERFINHSCDPNAFQRRIGDVSQVIALKPIRPNQEIVMHYGVDLANGESWVCNCGSERCLGTVAGDFFSLPLDTQVELSPFLSEWFIREHQAEYQALLIEGGLGEDATT